MSASRWLPWLLVLFLAACGDSGGPAVTTVAKPATPAPAVPAATPAAPGKKIGLVMKTLTNPFFIEMEKGARRAEKELGVELQVKTAAQDEVLRLSDQDGAFAMRVSRALVRISAAYFRFFIKIQVQGNLNIGERLSFGIRYRNINEGGC